jgi:signal transduction histidine kinase
MNTTFTKLIGRVVVPTTTVRWRLTLLYGAMFLACGAALLVITYALVDHATVSRTILQHIGPVSASNRRLLDSSHGRAFAVYVTHQQRIHDLHQLVIWSVIALAAMALASMLLGWIVAGRVLAPLRTITSTTQQISAGNLHERLAIAGPRDELTQLAGTIDGLLERLDGSFEAQRRFVANASHELRTPLAMMRTFLDVAVAKPDGVPPQTRALDADLRGALDHADRLLESFLVLAQAQHGELGDQQLVNLEQLVTAAVRNRTAQIAARGIDVHMALHPARVVGSETLLTRLVENVIENAIRHNQEHGSIDVTLTRDAMNARLVIDSDGDVLDEQAVAQLAQPFRRLDQDRTGSQNGHGLGLSIIAAIAAAHDGTLELHARRQGGLRVRTTLPDASSTQPTRATK